VKNEMSVFARTIMEEKYSHTKRSGRKETWPEISRRVSWNVLSSVNSGKKEIRHTEKLIRSKKFVPGGRYLYAAGRALHQCQNCLLLSAEDSREGWSNLLQKASMALMTGAGIGVVYSDIREEGAPIRRTGGTATGPTALLQMVNECARGIIQGGNRRSAVWGGLSWSHADVLKFIKLKDWIPEVCELKKKDFSFPATLDMTNISVCLDDEFFAAYKDSKHPKHTYAQLVYWEVVRHMLETGEPGFTVDVGVNAGERLRNACGEACSSDDSDVCNLGSVNLSRINSLDEMRDTVRHGTRFLLAGTVYSDVPYHQVDVVRRKNRRLGLGLMGVHEWLLSRGKKYGPDAELEQYLQIYAEESRKAADESSKSWKLSNPVKCRAIAPTGTTGIVAETTTGVEPIFCVTYKRRYLKHKLWAYQYVIDPCAKRLIEKGVSPESIEDAYVLASDVERRIVMQSWIQSYVDQGVSSSINLPAWGTELNNEFRVKDFGAVLLKHLPSLRGITVYPDGARNGQPLTPVSFKEAQKHVGEVFIEGTNVCSVTGRGSCGE